MKKIICKIFGHKLKVIDTYLNGTCQKLYCERCRRYYGINHSVKAFITWDSELEYNMNEELKIERKLNKLTKEL